MAITNICGFESARNTNITGAEEFSTNNLTDITLSTSIVRSGQYSLRCNPAGSGVAAGFIALNLAATGVEDLTVGLTNVWASFWFRYATKPTSASEQVAGFNAALNATRLSVRLTSDAKLSIYDKDDVLVATGSTVLSADTWYAIDLRGQYSATGSYELRIAGVTELSGTANQLDGADSPQAFLALFLGKRVNKNSNTVDYYFDDVQIDNASFPNTNGKIVRLDPDGTSASTNWDGSHTDVDDYATAGGCDDDTTYRRTATSGVQTLTHTLTSAASAGIGLADTIIATKALSHTRDENQTVNHALGTKSSTTTAYKTTLDGFTSFEYRADLRTVDPHTSVAWTPSGLDGAEVSVQKTQTQARALRVSAVGMMVAYIPAQTQGGKTRRITQAGNRASSF